MLGLLDLVRAVKGTVTLAVRRLHPAVGAVLVAVLWMGALGALLTLTRDEPSRPPASAAPAAERADIDWPTPTSAADGTGESWSQDPDWAPADGPTTTTLAAPADGDLAAAPGDAPPARPSRGTPATSVATTETTTSPTTTTAPGSSTTTTTTPPASGGLLGGLIDLLGLGKR